MLALCEERLPHDPETELRIAAEEQRRITHLRLRKMLG
jgi:2-oxo-4-hydroxy-4-carboxy--5-ureidoimidazoline (OHCU) decarboxylase